MKKKIRYQRRTSAKVRADLINYINYQPKQTTPHCSVGLTTNPDLSTGPVGWLVESVK